MFSLLRPLETLRGLRRASGFFGAAVLSLALGVGGMTAFFGLVRHFLLKPLPYAQPERLVALQETRVTGGKVEALPMGPSDFQAWREDARSFEAMGLFRCVQREVEVNGNPALRPVAHVTEGFFEALGIRPVLGRFVTRADEGSGAPRVAVLGMKAWRDQYGSRQDILGQTVKVGGVAHQVIGVAPSFVFPHTWFRREPVAFPILRLGSRSENRDLHMFSGLARLRSGVTHAQAQAELQTIQVRQEAAFPDSNRGNGAQIVGLRTALFGDRTRVLGLLTGAASLLMLMACLNGASLFLARGLAKARETALRAALGAETRHLFAPFLGEGLVVALGGTAGGLFLGWQLLILMPRLLAEAAPLAGASGPSLDWGLVAFASSLALLCSLIISAVPVLRVRRLDLLSTLQEGGRGNAGRGSHLRSGLLALEVAMAVVLLVGTGLLIRSMGRLMHRDLGFSPKGLATFHVDVSIPPLRDRGRMDLFQRQLLERVRALPGIQSAALVSHAPTDGIGEISKFRRGPAQPPVAGDPEVPILSVSDGAFETLGVRLLRGRGIEAGDGPGRPGVVLVNEAFARKHFPGEEPVGQMLRASYLDGPLQVVGVVADTRIGGPTGEVQPLLIHAMAQVFNGEFLVLLRSGRPLSELTPGLEAAVRAAEPTRRVLGLSRVEEHIRESLEDRRNTLILLGAFALLALTLAGVGLYGITAYAVAQRQREIGLRMALGGSLGIVLRAILRREMAFVALGALAGFVASMASARLLQAHLVDVTAVDPWALFGTTLVLALVGFLATLLPALRAARVQPAVALRSE